jgi:tetratricopeptide (TPR) repeat protein
MEIELVSKLTQWHEEYEHQKIVDTVMEISPKDRDYETISSLGRALNNLGRYKEALEQFLSIEELGQNDPIFHFRMGYAYFYLKQYEEAVRVMGIAHALDPADEITVEWLNRIQRRLHQEEQAIVRRELSKQRKDSGTPMQPFEGMDFSGFWDDCDYSLKEYIDAPPTDEMIASVEEELGYKLPNSYITLMKQHNGGIPHNIIFPTEEATSWAEDHIAITGIMGIGREKSLSICGTLGSPFMIEEWGYPDIGVVICDCPSAGHDVVMLDYRHCGKDGEPEVIHVDQEDNYNITFLAEDFETFIRGLVNEEDYDT